MKDNEIIRINLNNENRNIKINDNRIKYTNKEYDITIIEIKPKEDKIYNFIEIDENIFKNNPNNIYDKESIYPIQYKKENNITVSYGIINNINESNIYHYSNTDIYSLGSPIFNLTNNKIIGINTDIKNENNIGIFLKYPLINFFNY